MVEPGHLRLDFSFGGSRAVAVHREDCPDIGPICAVRAEPPQRHHTVLYAGELRLQAELGVAAGWAAQLSLPVRLFNTSTRYTDLGDTSITLDYPSLHHRDETLVGLGDVQVIVHRALRAGVVRLGARAGLSLPFGTVHEDPFRLGDLGLPHEHLQFGTGTVDPILALDASVPVLGVTAAAWALAQLPLYQGPQGYRAGARVLGGATVSRPFGALSLRLGATVLHEEAERWHGAVPQSDGNEGRTDLYLAPGLTWNFAGEWMLSADVDLRVYSHTVNAQLDLPVVLQLGIGRLFHFEQGFAEAPTPPGADVLDVVQAGELAPLEAAPGRFTVIDFWAPWCEACKTLDRDLRALAAKRPGLAVRRVNIVDFNSPIARRELPGVSVLPHLRLLGGPGQLLYEASGPADELLAEVERRTR